MTYLHISMKMDLQADLGELTDKPSGILDTVSG